MLSPLNSIVSNNLFLFTINIFDDHHNILQYLHELNNIPNRIILFSATHGIAFDTKLPANNAAYISADRRAH